MKDKDQRPNSLVGPIVLSYIIFVGVIVGVVAFF